MIKKIFFICFLIGCISCKRQKDSVPELVGLEYFPTDTGRYWAYTVHEIKYNNDTIDTTYNRKDIIHEVFQYQQVSVYELYRYYKPTTTTDWPLQPDSVWTFTTDQNRITVKENNIEFIRLVFPLSKGKTWNGNAKNQSLRDDYIIASYNKFYTLGSLYFPETATVIEEQTMNLVLKDYRSRVYAKNVGLIYKKYVYL